MIPDADDIAAVLDATHPVLDPASGALVILLLVLLLIILAHE